MVNAKRIVVIEPGMLTTVQDLGRLGYRKYGVPVAGACDTQALCMANGLVGNDEHLAGLELTLFGGQLQLDPNTIVAVTGADLQPEWHSLSCHTLPFPQGRPVLIREAGTLRFRATQQGCRAYLAVAGGIEVPKVMGSRATDLRAKIGGHQGRRLQRGDVLTIGERADEATSHAPETLHASASSSSLNASALKARLLDYPVKHGLSYPPFGIKRELESERVVPLRVTVGQHFARLTETSRAAFERGEFLVTANSDRMGYRLQGEMLQLTEPLNLLSAGVTIGTVQLPPSGHPILLMVDAAPTGGYPCIAHVISADLALAGQCQPGDRVTFTVVSPSLAIEAWQTSQDNLARQRSWMRSKLAISGLSETKKEASKLTLDLNCDLGELEEEPALESERQLMAIISSVNIACGGHAGSEARMRLVMQLAIQHGVAIGAHPGFEDRENFGRRELSLSREAIAALIERQCGRCSRLAKELGVELQHVKPHGALYNMAADQAEVAAGILDGLDALRSQGDITNDCRVVGLPDSCFETEAKRRGYAYRREFFADRQYRADGKLVSRALPGAVIHKVESMAERVVRALVEHRVTAIDGALIPIKMDTLCLHGDTPDAVSLARELRKILEMQGIRVKC